MTLENSLSVSNPLKKKNSAGEGSLISTQARTKAWSCWCSTAPSRSGKMQRSSEGLLPIPQWNFTGGINSVVVNTLCVASTEGKFGIMGGATNMQNAIHASQLKTAVAAVRKFEQSYVQSQEQWGKYILDSHRLCHVSSLKKMREVQYLYHWYTGFFVMNFNCNFQTETSMQSAIY